MKTPQHIFYALMAFSISMFVFSIAFDYKSIGIWTWLGLFTPIVLAIVCNEAANMIELKLAEDSAVNKKKSEDDRLDKNDPSVKSRRSFDNLVKTRFRIATWIFLFTVIVVCTYVALPSSANPVVLIFGYMVTVFGGTFPDFIDAWIPGDMRFHRDPRAHSALFSIAAGIGTMIMIPFNPAAPEDILYLDVSWVLLGIAFVLGNAVHLACDNIESDATLADLIKHPPSWSESPGDIRKIRENRERDWLLLGIISSAIVLFFQFARYQVYPWMDGILVYDFLTGSISFSPISLIVLGITGLLYIMYIIAYFSWRDADKKKYGTTKTSKKQRSPSTPKKAKSGTASSRDPVSSLEKNDEKPVAKPSPVSSTQPSSDTDSNIIQTKPVKKPAKPRTKPTAKPDDVRP